MTGSPSTISVRVVHRFDASAERVYDAFLDPARAGRFLFATGTGEIVRCDIDPRVGGTFTITDRRNGEDVVHAGTYLELVRPQRIVFRFSVEKYSSDADTVTIDIAPAGAGCELTLTHTMSAEYAAFEDQTRRGWRGILDVAALLVAEQAPTCGVGVAQHAAIPATIGVMFDGLAETFALHRRMLRLDDPASRAEDEVYRVLGGAWRDIARAVSDAAAQMAAQRDLPMGAHDESAWDDAHTEAFAKVVTAQSQLLALLRVAAPRDEEMLASMKRPQ